VKMGLREANQNFSRAIKAVKAGEVVVLTERGRPIATIQPYKKAASDEDAIVQLEQEGILRPNPQAGLIRDNWKPLSVKRASLSKTLRELRDQE
jgi:prevent-host-death family protein